MKITALLFTLLAFLFFRDCYGGVDFSCNNYPALARCAERYKNICFSTNASENFRIAVGCYVCHCYYQARLACERTETGRRIASAGSAQCYGAMGSQTDVVLRNYVSCPATFNVLTICSL